MDLSDLPPLGSTIETCRLDELLHVSPTSAIYRVYNENMAVKQAVKICRPAASEPARKLFLVKRNFLAKLSHPNLVMLQSGFSWAPGLPGYQMELIDGYNLDQSVSLSGKFPEDVCLAMTVRILATLNYVVTALVDGEWRRTMQKIDWALTPNDIMITAKAGQMLLLGTGINHAAEQRLTGGVTSKTDALDIKDLIYSVGMLIRLMASGKTAPLVSSFRMSPVTRIENFCFDLSANQRPDALPALLKSASNALSEISSTDPEAVISRHFTQRE
jgi:hypothetical protein